MNIHYIEMKKNKNSTEIGSMIELRELLEESNYEFYSLNQNELIDEDTEFILLKVIGERESSPFQIKGYESPPARVVYRHNGDGSNIGCTKYASLSSESTCQILHLRLLRVILKIITKTWRYILIGNL